MKTPFDPRWIAWGAFRDLLPGPRLYTIGYGSTSDAEHIANLDALAIVADGVGARVIVDCRTLAWGGRIRPGWQRKDLMARFGERYQWKGDVLGGKERLRGKPTTPEGLQWLAAQVREHSALCLCACSQRDACHLHRIVATDLLDKRFRDEHKIDPVSIVHLWCAGGYATGDTLLAATDGGAEAFERSDIPLRDDALSAAEAWYQANF